MDNQEYEQKKRECWENFCRHIVDEEEEFYNMFDLAYSLGKQKETVTQEEVEKAEQMFDFGPLIEKAVRETTFKDFRAADFKGA